MPYTENIMIIILYRNTKTNLKNLIYLGFKNKIFTFYIMNIKETILLIIIYLTIIFLTLWSQGYIKFESNKKLSKRELIIMNEKLKKSKTENK